MLLKSTLFLLVTDMFEDNDFTEFDYPQEEWLDEMYKDATEKFNLDEYLNGNTDY